MPKRGSDECGECMFAHPSTDDSYVYCHHDSPKATHYAGRMEWPLVRTEDWCGQFQPVGIEQEDSDAEYSTSI